MRRERAGTAPGGASHIKWWTRAASARRSRAGRRLGPCCCACGPSPRRRWSRPPRPPPRPASPAPARRTAWPSAAAWTRTGPVSSLAERRNGKKWSVVAMPSRPARRGTLYSVTCTSTRNCVAVACSTSAPTARARWPSMERPQVVGDAGPVPRALGEPPVRHRVERAATCWPRALGKEHPLDRWNVGNGRRVSSPNPHPAKPNVPTAGLRQRQGALGRRRHVPRRRLRLADRGLEREVLEGRQHAEQQGRRAGRGCLCPACCRLPVGTAKPVRTGPAVDRARVGQHSTPKPSGASSAQLDAAACASPSACVGVGMLPAKGKFKVLAERWTGAKWVAAHRRQPGAATVADAGRGGLRERRNCGRWAATRPRRRPSCCLSTGTASPGRSTARPGLRGAMNPSRPSVYLGDRRDGIQDAEEPG